MTLSAVLLLKVFLKVSEELREPFKRVGMARVLAERVDKARLVKRGQRPLCRTKCIERLKAYNSEYLGFKARFQELYRALRDSLLPNVPRLDLLFPSGGARLLGVGTKIITKIYFHLGTHNVTYFIIFCLIHKVLERFYAIIYLDLSTGSLSLHHTITYLS